MNKPIDILNQEVGEPHSAENVAADSEPGTSVIVADDQPNLETGFTMKIGDSGLSTKMTVSRCATRAQTQDFNVGRFAPLKKQDLRLFKTYAARCSISVKSKFEDMRDCHSASSSLAEVLNWRGFADARVIGCTILIGDRTRIASMLGKYDVTETPAHSVVMVNGCLIDATVGQFRTLQVKIPDYLILPAHITVPMLECNRRLLETQEGESYLYSQKNGGYNFTIAYIPTDPGFSIEQSRSPKPSAQRYISNT